MFDPMNKDVITLLEDIGRKRYSQVKIHLEGSNLRDVIGVLSHDSKFNFSVRILYEDSVRTIPIIKYGEIQESYTIICTTSAGEVLSYVTGDMPIYSSSPRDISEILISLLKEYRLDEELSIYKDLKKTLPREVPVGNREYTTSESENTPLEDVSETVLVPHVQYKIQTKLTSTINESSIRESCSTWEQADESYKSVFNERSLVRFFTRAMIFQAEASGISSTCYQWSETQPLPHSKKKSYQEWTLPAYNFTEGSDFITIRRTFWDEEIKL